MRLIRNVTVLSVLLSTAGCAAGGPMEPAPSVSEVTADVPGPEPVTVGVPVQPAYDGGPTIGSGYSKPQA